MLRYNHTFNTDLDYPFHIHAIESNTTSVAINLNGIFIGYYKPTAGTSYSFNKIVKDYSILDLMVVGSRQTYTAAKEASFFKSATIKFIQNTAGDSLVKNNETGRYYWSNTKRTRFFFNPEYFNSGVLWKYVTGYVPTGVTLNNYWTDAAAEELFFNKIYVTDETWVGEKIINDVDPVTEDPYSNEASGVSKSIDVDLFIDELQDLVDGDIITIDNGTDSLEVTVANCYTSATYPAINITDRPINHVAIDIVNPNKRVNYSKALAIGVQETINLVLYNNNIQFTIERADNG